MSERTLWLGIKTEAKQKAESQRIRLDGLIKSLRSALVLVDGTKIDHDLVMSLATDIVIAKSDWIEADETYRKACAELGERP
jgi:hypothetical protein